MNYKDYYSKTGIPKQVSQEGNKACFKKTLQIQSTYIMRILYEISSFPKADDSFNINTSNIRFYDDGFSTNLSSLKGCIVNVENNFHTIGANRLNLPT